LILKNGKQFAEYCELGIYYLKAMIQIPKESVDLATMARPIYLLNAFSIQMIDLPCFVRFTEVTELPEGLTSAIGHQDTANVLGVPMNRINVKLQGGDTAYIAQLQGGRLPEGCTTLPEGFKFKFIKVKVHDLAPDMEPVDL
jgi:hypothetical protein